MPEAWLSGPVRDVHRRHLALLASAFLAAPAALSAQTPNGKGPIDVEAAPRPEARATRASGPIVLDGVLDEAAWAEAPTITGFIQARPDRGWPETERTEARILYDDEGTRSCSW